jgi:ABC-type spermidine/putrescine transport system permease subunit II
MLGAVGWIYLANKTPAVLDSIFRDRLAVCIVLACRVLPVAFVIMLRRWIAFSPSWTMAAAIHGVPSWTFFRRVILPHQAPGFCLAILLCAMLACSEINIALLLHPPGEASLPLAIFTIMANAPDTLVAALCLLYLVLALPVTLLVFQIGERQ